MTEHIFTNYDDAANALRIKDLKQSLYDDGEVIMDQVLVCLHGEEHKKRRKLENKIFKRDIFKYYENEVFPKTISAVSFGHGQVDEIQKISVTLAFKNWINLTMDKTGTYTTGSSYGKPAVIRAEDNSFFGGLLNKLPPELKRAGRDVVNTIKQRVPIGAVTGGKVFPPLF